MSKPIQYQISSKSIHVDRTKSVAYANLLNVFLTSKCHHGLNAPDQQTESSYDT